MKKAALAVAIVALALIGLAFLLPFAVNSGGLRTALASQLSEVSGAEIALNGTIHFSVLPEFGIVAEDMVLKTGDGAVAVAAARSVASVELLPLLSGQVRVSGIELKSPRIVLDDTVTDASAAPSATEPDDDADIFKTIAFYLERLSFSSVVVSDGEIARRTGEITEPMASAIELRLSAPGLDRPVAVSMSGVTRDGKMALDANIGSLGNLLARQPTEFSLSAQAERPLHPMLAEVSASGNIQLADDGSYRISGGEIASNGQKMQLDISYTPADRPFVMARIDADALDYSDFQPAAAASDENAAGPANAAAGGADLSALRTLDADIELHAASLRAGDALAQDVTISVQLQAGKLVSVVQSAAIAGGSLAASIAMDVNAEDPQSSGSLNMSSIDIASLVALAGQQAPASGKISSQLQYAFRGLDGEAIRNSLNLRGEVSIAGGRVNIPQLETMVRPGAGVVESLEASLRIEDVRQPLSLSGTAHWNGEPLSFSTSLALADLLWGQPGQVALDLKTAPVNAGFAGTLNLDGTISGKADIAAPSLTQAANWMGQNLGAQLGRFAFSGGIAVDSGQVALSEASISLDDIQVRGSLAATTSGKPKVTATLAVDALDFGTLTGSGQESATGSSSGPAAIDLSVLRLFDADIRLQANQLSYGAVKAGPATASLSVSDGVAALSVPQAGFYDGTLSASVTANGSGTVPAVALTAGMEGVQALPLLTAAAGFQNIEGTLKANIEVSGAGADSQAFARSLRGPVALVFNDGALRGIDVAGLVRNVQSLLVAGYSANNEAKTEFTEFSVAADIQDGVGTVSDIRLLGPFVRMTGSGSFDIAAQAIDMRLDPRVVASLDGQGSDFDVSGLGMPILVKGPLSGPAIYPDLSALLADPGRALASISQLGNGVGGLAEGAANALGGLDGVLNGDPSTMAGGAVTDLIGQFAGGQAPVGADGQPSSESLLNELIGGVFGQQQPGAETAPADPVQAPSPAVSLPRPDPRGPAVAPTTLPPPPTQTEQLIDLIAPPVAPDTEESGNDPLGGLLDQLGM
ncbi:AsmA family protein [Devosia ginsengisoli]|uniref:AsmA family protein n=1 Tax=Devosia ginsengisoli TaxID=400770 RepID=UPI0026E96BA1|nr:AsmA family protein [Devosia ginsengisoli]MCR6671495.1 AsmA family protein [Devosia ginsengisoli]